MSIDIDRVMKRVRDHAGEIEKGRISWVSSLKLVAENENLPNPESRLFWCLIGIIGNHECREFWYHHLNFAEKNYKDKIYKQESEWWALGCMLAHEMHIAMTDVIREGPKDEWPARFIGDHAAREMEKLYEKQAGLQVFPVGHIARLDLREEPGEAGRVAALAAKLTGDDEDGLLPWERS